MPVIGDYSEWLILLMILMATDFKLSGFANPTMCERMPA
jgi:hypothetical protein